MSVFGAFADFSGRRMAPVLSVLHHRRHHRLLRHARLSATELQRARSSWWGGDPHWYPRGTPPRRHNRVTPLIDGDRFLGALAESLDAAQSYVYIAGWCLTPAIPLWRGTRQETVAARLVDLLRGAAARVPVRILLWGGSRALVHPTRGDVEQVARAFDGQAHANLVCRLDHTAHLTHCHHQKAIVVDGQIAFVGGMDLTTFDGDRWDLSGHPLRAGPNWHDVQVKLEGEVVADVEQNFRQRWQGAEADASASTGPGLARQRLPGYDPAWDTPAQIVRTIPPDVYRSVQQGEFGVRHAYLTALHLARRYIYLENQYLWSPQVMDVLSDQLQRRRAGPFRILIVLPAGAHNGKWDNDRHVKKLRALDNGRGIVSIYSLYASGPSAGTHPFRYKPVYVHAKVAVVDDEWLTVGSANLNNRGLLTDSELNVVAQDRAVATRLRVDLWAEHLALSREQVQAADPLALIDGLWRQRAAENARIGRLVDRGDEPLIGGVRHYALGRFPASWFLDEAEALTFEH